MKKILSIFLSLMMLASCMVSFADDTSADESVAKALMLESSIPEFASEDSTAKNASFTFNNDISSVKITFNGEEMSTAIDGNVVTVDEELLSYADYEAVITAIDVYGQSLSKKVYFSTSGNSKETLATDESEGGDSYPYDANGLLAKPKTYLTSAIQYNGKNFVLYKLPVPDTKGKFLDYYTLKYVGNVQSGINILKFAGEDWDTATLSFNDERVKEIVDNYGSYGASKSTSVVKLANYTFEYTCDLTNYAKECLANGQEYMYVGFSSRSTSGVYNFKSNYPPKWTYGIANYEFRAVEAEVCVESSNVSSLSFKLLTEVEDIDSVVAIRDKETGETLSASFELNPDSEKYELLFPLELSEGSEYELVLLGGSEDKFGNTLDKDVVIADFYASAEGFEPGAKNDGEDVFDVTVNADSSTITIFYKNPLYSLCNTNVTIAVEGSDEAAYSEVIKSGSRGTVYLEDISLSESGNYEVKVYPENASYCVTKNFKFVSAEDTLRLWNIVAFDGSDFEIADEWELISELFGLESEYFENITDMYGFFDKLVQNRGNSLSEMNAENISALRSIVGNYAFFTALEQTKEAGEFVELLNSALPLVMAADSDVYELWLECAQSEYYEETVQALIDIIDTVSSGAELAKVIDNALNVYRVEIIFDLLESADHASEITEIILAEGNAEILGIEKYMDDYKDLGSKTKVNKELMESFDNVKDFAKVFEDAVKEAKKGQKKPESPSSNKGSGKGSSTGGATQIVSSAPVEQTTFNPFDDIENYGWAKEHISKLYNKGIINGKGKNKFAPQDTVTREEITKLLVTLGNFTTADNVEGFDDVESGSWYEEYVNIAVSNGIVNGMGNSKFGTGMKATRQDIAVMIVNMLTKLGVTVEDGNLTFGDGEAISDYAKNPVAFLASKGILTGDTFGNFNPKANATRAEVAVMLSRVCDVFVKEVN